MSRPDAGEGAACTTDSQCGCGLSCGTDSLVGTTYCQFACQQSSDCASALEVCQSYSCHQNECGGASGNGQYAGPCNISDAGDGFCYPFFQGGETLGLCQLAGTAAVGAGCAFQPTRSTPPAQLCGPNAICESTCLLACDPLEVNTCAAGTVCTPYGGESSAHLGVCKPGQPYDGGYAAPHLPLPNLPFNGGSVINSPKVVTLSFPSYGFGVSSYADWIVGSTWLKTVGLDYGVGLGSHLKDFVFPSAAPAQVSDAQIQKVLTSWMSDGGIPTSTANTIYLVYYPDTTTVSASLGVGCNSFFGYHSQYQLSNGTPVTYGVIATCKDSNGDPDYNEAALTTSHELVEAATDPNPRDPGYRFNDVTLAWTYTFSEAADLCTGSIGTYDSSFAAQRIWSNTAAKAGSASPCVPVPPGEIYLNVSALPNGTQFVPTSTTAQTVTYQITPWSLSPHADWVVIASQLMGNFQPNITLTGGKPLAAYVVQVNNGDAITMQVTIPPGTPSGSYAGIQLASAANQSLTNYTLWSAAVIVK